MTPHLFGLICAAAVLVVVLAGPLRRWLAERRMQSVRRGTAEQWRAQFEQENPEGPPLSDEEIAGHVAWFESLARDALILRPDPAGDPIDAAARIGGRAWLAPDETWPLDKDGAQLEFVAQVNFARLPPLAGFPSRGIARFFVGRDDLFGADFDHPDQSQARVLWHDGADVDGRLEAPARLGADDSSPFQGYAARQRGVALAAVPIRDLPDSYSWEPEARLAGSLRREGIDEVSDRFYELSEGREYGHRIGGYPVFTQSDFRKHDDHDDFDTVLLGLSSDDAIMWGDVGEAVFLIRGADLARGDLSRVAFYWDCH